MKRITGHPLNRFIFAVMLVLLATIMMTFVGVTQVSAQSSPEGVYEAWVAHYDGPTTGNVRLPAIALDGSGNIYVTASTKIGRGISTNDYATVKYDTDGNQLWAVHYDGPANGDDFAGAIAVDVSGNVYVTGVSRVGPGFIDDYATVKYDTDGNQLWVAHYGGPPLDWDRASDIAVDGLGNVYVTGLNSSGSSTGDDYDTVKYDTNGNQLWVARYDGGAGNDSAKAIAVDSSGNVYVTGSSAGSGNATVKYDTNGNQLWVAHYDSPAGMGSETRAIAVNGLGKVYVTGDSRVGGGLYDNDYATIKYDTNGNQLWAAHYDGPEGDSDRANAIAVDGSGNVYVTGGSGYGYSYPKYATVKYDTNGNQLWAVRYDSGGNLSAMSIAVDGSGNVYITGGSDGSFNSDFVTVKYDLNGNQLWVKHYDSPAGMGSETRALAVDSSDNVYVTGFSFTGALYYDWVTIKYSTDGNGNGGGGGGGG